MSGRGTARAERSPAAARRAIGPVVGVVVLCLLTVALATVVAVGVGTLSLAPAPNTAFDLAVDGTDATITLEHVAGDPVDVEALSVTVAVEGTALSSQPPVPFVGADGFDGAPRGPFNAASESTWETGERAGVTVAGTNEPAIAPGETVSVTLAVDGRRVATLEATAT